MCFFTLNLILMYWMLCIILWINSFSPYLSKISNGHHSLNGFFVNISRLFKMTTADEIVRQRTPQLPQTVCKSSQTTTDDIGNFKAFHLERKAILCENFDVKGATFLSFLITKRGSLSLFQIRFPLEPRPRPVTSVQNYIRT